MRNFGFKGPEAFAELGINGKNSELHAAMGLANIKFIDEILRKRQLLTKCYLKNLKNLKATLPKWHEHSSRNYAYFSLVLESEDLLSKIKYKLDSNEVYTRRYFYPSLASTLPYLEKQQFQITDDIARRVLCLPLYYDLTEEEVTMISRLMLRVQNN